MNLIFGRIGKLHMKIPWSQISSQPCILHIESVNIVVNLKGKDEWDQQYETIHTNFDLKIAMLNSILSALFQELSKSKTESAQETSKLRNLMTRMIDNLQVNIKNLHIRLESNNPQFSADRFSMGFTLQSLKLDTTDADWKTKFIDRTQNEIRTLYKLMAIKNLGFYYKPNESEFITEIESDKKRLQKLQKIFTIGETKIEDFKNDYLLEPMELNTKLKIDPLTSNIAISLEIVNLEIQMHKKQLKNIAKLIELDHEYNSLLSSKQFKIKQKFTNELNDKFDQETMIQKFKQIILERKDEWADNKVSKKIDEEYVMIVMGCSIEDLQIWAKPVVQEYAQEFINKKKPKQSYITSFMGWYYSAPTEETEETPSIRKSQVNLKDLEAALQVGIQENSSSSQSLSDKGSSEDEFFDAVEEHSQEHLIIETKLDPLPKLKKQNSSQSKIGKKLSYEVSKQKEQEPTLTADFLLNDFKLMLIEKGKNKPGIMIHSNGFSISFKKYKEEELNPFCYEIKAKTKAFGIISTLNGVKQSAIIEKIQSDQDSAKAVSQIKVTKNNVNFNQSSVLRRIKSVQVTGIDKDGEEIDLTIIAVLNPIKIVYRPVEISKLIHFFTIDSDEIKKRAKVKLTELRDKAYEQQKAVLVESQKKNNITIEIKCPVIELPFSNNPTHTSFVDQQGIEEKWEIRMGDFTFSNQTVQLQRLQYSQFTLQVQNGCFRYLSAVRQHALINDFTMTLTIAIKKEIYIDIPNIIISGEMHKIAINFTPYLYNQIVNITKLLYQQKDQDTQADCFSKLEDKAVHQGYVKVQGFYVRNLQKFYALLYQDTIFLYPEDTQQNQQPLDKFQLQGCKVLCTESNLQIVNDLNVKELFFETADDANQWKTVITQTLEIKENSPIKNDDSSADEDEEKQKEQKNHRKLISTFSLHIPEIYVHFFADKDELRPELKFQDPYDVGIFSFEDAQIQQFKLLLKISGMTIIQKSRAQESQISITCGSINLAEEDLLKNERFSYLLNADQGLIIRLKYVDRKSSFYQNEDMIVKIDFKSLNSNWKPRQMTRFLRFIRYNKFKTDAYNQQLEGFQTRHNQMKLLQSQQFGRRNTIRQTYHGLSGEVNSNFMDCQTNKEVLMFVTVVFQQVKIICLHPDNNSYPIFSIVLKHKVVEYKAMFDHDEISVQMDNLQIFDHTCYPKTLDPQKKYFKNDPLQQQEILYKKMNRQDTNDYMMSMKMIMFHYPMERTCHIARQEDYQKYDKHVKIDLKSMNLVMIMEYMYRIQDYLFVQLIGAASDTNPFFKLSEKAKEDFESTIKLQKKDSFKNVISNDLKQYTLCTGLDITLNHPVIILKDRPYLKGKIQIDFGEIKISNNTSQTTGRWQKRPDEQVQVTTMTIKGSGFTMSYIKPSGMKAALFKILNSTAFQIDMERLNYTELLSNQYLSKGFDFEDLDISQHIKIRFHAVKLEFTQEVYTYFLRCNDLNIAYSDELSNKFQLAIWNDSDTQKFLKMEEEIQKKFEGNTKVFKMRVEIKMPSFSIAVNNNEDELSLIAEIVYWNYVVDIQRFLDRRNDIHLQAQSLQILRLAHNHKFQLNQKIDVQNCKALIMGHQLQYNYLVTDSDYYNFTQDKITKVTQSKGHRFMQQAKKILQDYNFEVQIQMMPSGEKIIKCRMTKHKIFMKTKILLQISNFFNTAWPNYEKESFDKPIAYTTDKNQAQRQEIMIEMEESLICFESEEDSVQTLVCHGSLIVNKTREMMNQVKLMLLDRLHQKIDHLPDSEFDFSGKTGILLLSLTQFSPYLCQTSDLDGAPFRTVKKRELMSPFNMHYNVQDLIELKQKYESHNDNVKNLVFRVYSKQDASIDWSLIKITFLDMQVMQKIIQYNLEMLSQFQEELNTKIYDSNSNDSDYEQSEDSSDIKESESSFDSSKMKIKVNSDSEEDESSNSENSTPKQNFKEKKQLFISPLKRRKSIYDMTLHMLKKATQEESLKIDNPFYVIQQPITQIIQMSTSPAKRREPLKSNQIIQEQVEIDSSVDFDSGDESEVNLKEIKMQPIKCMDYQSMSEKQSNKGLDVSYMTDHNISMIQIINTELSEALPKKEIFLLKSVPRDDIKKYIYDSELIRVINQEKGNDSMQVVSYGFQFLVINDNDGNFLPVFGIQLSQFLYSNDCVKQKQIGKTSFSTQISYYNALAGSWEPAVESFHVSLRMSSLGVKKENKDITLYLGEQEKRENGGMIDKAININLSDSLFKTITDTAKSIKNLSDQDVLFKEVVKSQGLVQGNFINFQDIYSIQVQQNQEETIVTPYAICNMTDTEIHIEKEVVVEQNKIVPSLDKHLATKSEKEKVKFETKNSKNQRRTTITKPIAPPIRSSLASILTGQNSRGSGPSAQVQTKMEVVLVVKPNQTQNFAVDYEKQVRQQINQYTQSNNKTEEIINVSFGRANKAPIIGVNLNKLGQAHRHYFQNEKYKEFLIYVVTFKQLKRVLTIRTQFVIQNQTLQDYDIQIINKFDRSLSKKVMLKAGDIMPLPESYNQSILQLKLSPTQENSDETWSKEWHVYAIKKILQPQKAGYLQHGNTYTFFRKIQAEHSDTYNIVLMPPLVLKNALPCDLHLQFIDSSNKLCKIVLQKETTKNIFQFDLQNEIKLQICIRDYKYATLVLDTKVELLEECRDQICLSDSEGAKLNLQYTKSSKTAGFSLIFFVANCLINQTQQNLAFFYQEPQYGRELQIKDKEEMLSVPIELDNQKQQDKLYMMSATKEVWAKIDGAHDVSQSINTLQPGVNQKFSLIKKNRLYEYGYITDIYLASKVDFIYTKITTISPLYLIVNYTKSTILFAQTATKHLPLFIKPNQILPFNWSDKDKEREVSVKVIPSKHDQNYADDFDWSSSGISLDQMGTVIVYNRQIPQNQAESSFSLERSYSGFQIFQKSDLQSEGRPIESSSIKRFLRISRKYHKHQIFVIVEEEDPSLPTMKISNHCEQISIVYSQFGNLDEREIDVVEARQSQAFTWTNHQGKLQLKIEFYLGENYTKTSPRLDPIFENQKSTFIVIALDELNFPQRQVLFVNNNTEQIYYTVTTNGYTKILQFTNKTNFVDLKSSLLEAQPETKLELKIPQINFSLIGMKQQLRTELLMIYCKGISVKVESWEKRIRLDYRLSLFQIDNQSERDPIYPVMLQAKAEKQSEETKQQDLFQLNLEMRKDVQNVIYFELVQFLVQHLEVKLELSHLVLLAEFAQKIGKIFKTNLNIQHQIFQNVVNQPLFDIEQEESVLAQQKQEEREQDYLDRQRIAAKKRMTQVKQIRQSIRKPTSPDKTKKRLSQDESTISTNITKVYIKEFIGSPLKVTISLIKHGVTLNEDSNELSLFKTISSLGLSISTFEAAPITLNALKINNIFGESDEVTEQLKGYYISMVKWNTLSFLGASNLIGNPVKFISTLGSGFEEFYYEPYQGFMRGGVAAGGLGIVKGSASLVKNTFSASFSSIGKISSSLSAGMLAITGDDLYIQKRTMGMIREKPRGIMQGIEQGLSSALQSGWSGLKGVVDKPSEGYRTQGSSGFFKGALQGAAGLFVKPISGAMDLVVKTSEGIENSTKSNEELKQDERIRQPRVFYDSDHTYKEYDIVHANILSILPRLLFYAPDTDQTYIQVDVTDFYDAWILEESEEGYWHVLVLVTGSIVRVKRFPSQKALIEEQKTNDRLRKQGKSLIQIVSLNKISELKSVELYGQMLDLDFEDGREILEITEEKVAKAVEQKIKSLLKEYKKSERAKKIKSQQQQTVNHEMFSSSSQRH